MGLTFNSLLGDAEIDPSEVRLLRHQTVFPSGLTPFELWEQDRAGFDEYQAYQPNQRRSFFASRYWASFLGLRDGRTLFAGLYEVGEPELVELPYTLASASEPNPGGIDDRYPLRLHEALSQYVGLLYIDWGGGASGKRAWRQHAALHDKTITELHLERDAVPFPGFSAFIEPLSRILSLPPGWKQALGSSKGIYLLTCPRTNEIYVGSATGVDGFLGRWMQYAIDGHGGNIKLKRRDPSDYQVSILEVAGTLASDADILALEQRWKLKLQSRDMGLNAN